MREDDEEPSLLYIEERFVGLKPHGPHRLASWAAMRRQNTRAIGGSRTKGHTDPLWHINCARETRDLTSDTSAPGTVRMSLTRCRFQVILGFVEVSIKGRETGERSRRCSVEAG